MDTHYPPGPSEADPGHLDGWMGGRTDGQTDRRDVEIPPVFYRTLSPPVPFGAAAKKKKNCFPMTSKQVSKRPSE